MQLLLWILAIVVSLSIGYGVYRADVKRAVPYPWLTALLRTLVIFLTCLLLLAPSLTVTKTETQKPIILFLQDNSQSIQFALKGDTALYKKNTTQLLQKLQDDYRVIKWGFGKNIQNDTLFQYRQPATDIAHALVQAVDFYGQQNLGAIVLASDGRYNQGANPQFQDLSFQGNVYTVALGDSAVQKDVRVARTYANKTVTLNSQFEIRADIIAQRANGYNNNIRLEEAGRGAAGSALLHVNSDRFDRSVSFTVKADRVGLHHFIITAPAADGEQNTANNRKDVFVEVVNEKKKILIAAAAPHPDVNAIREALAGLEDYEIVVKTGDKIPSGFSDYQVLIVHSLPSRFNLMQQLASARKPVWFIMGAGSDNTAFNKMQNLARLNVNSSNLHNQFAVYNKSFSAFTMPQNIQAVMDKMPPLAVPAGTVQASPDALVLFSVRGRTDFLLWLLKPGTVPSALLTGEGIWRWRMYEFRHFNTHNTVDEAIRQTISFLSANASDKPFYVELPKYIWSDQEAISLNAFLLNANNEQINTPEVSLTITDSTGEKQRYNFERSGNAYKLNIGLRAAGTYAYSATTHYNGKELSSSGSFVIEAMPIEMMETGADYALLHSIAQKNQGAVVPSENIASLYDSLKNNKNIKPVIQSVTETVPLVDWKWYFFLILFIVTAEWLLRKYWLAQ